MIYNLNLFLGLGTIIRKYMPGLPMAVQWLRLHASTEGGVGPIPGLATKIPYAAWSGY